MKKNLICTTLAGFVSFMSAAVCAVLFLMGLLPSGSLFAQTGIFAALIILVLFAFTSAYARCRTGCIVPSSVCSSDTAVISAAALCVSVLLLNLPAEATALYTFTLFLTVFFWKFMLIIFGFSLAVRLQGCCKSDRTSCGTEGNAACP